VARHGLKVVCDKDSILLRGKGKHLGIRNLLQSRFIRREKIHCGLLPSTTSNDRMVEVGIRQEADHSSASPLQELPPHALELFFDVGRDRMRRDVGIFLTPALLNDPLHFVLVVQIEVDRAVDLLQG